MADILVWGLPEAGADRRSLSDGLRSVFPDSEVVDDMYGVLTKTETDLGRSAFDAEELRRRRESPPRLSVGYTIDLVALVLPTATAVVVKAVVDVAVDWLRGLAEKPWREKTIHIYGPDGEPLRAIRLRRDSEPELFTSPWPFPLRPGDPL
jgi:hypothetical protein